MTESATTYTDLRQGPSIVIEMGTVAAPANLARLAISDLAPEMRTVVDIARSLYERWLVSLEIVDDEQPRMLLVFAANIPEKTVTVRANLGKLGREVAAGLHASILRQAFSVLK